MIGEPVMRFSGCDVTSSNVLGRYVLHEQKGWDRGRWVCAPRRVQTAWLCLGSALEWALVNNYLWAISLLLCTIGLRKRALTL